MEDKKTYMILNYDKAKSVRKMLGLTDEQFINIIKGDGFLTTERVSLGKDILMRIGSYIDGKEIDSYLKLDIPFGIGINGLYVAVKKRHEYGLNDDEKNYFISVSKDELVKKYNYSRSNLTLLDVYTECFAFTLVKSNNRCKAESIALYELDINNIVNGKDIMEIYKTDCCSIMHSSMEPKRKTW